ncbi:hypothetical protein [Lactobacillus sp.]|uniref:hypothetical protein n=1 Tax=Lactobacillus sp. TaxID=1591 RepID=UPI003EF264B6
MQVDMLDLLLWIFLVIVLGMVPLIEKVQGRFFAKLGYWNLAILLVIFGAFNAYVFQSAKGFEIMKFICDDLLYLGAMYYTYLQIKKQKKG